MRTSFLFPMMFVSTLLFAGSSPSLSVEEAVKKKLIRVVLTGKGGHLGEVIQMKACNLQKQPLSVVVESGRRLDSKDSTVQDLLVTKSMVFHLAPYETRTCMLSGMCCQAHNACPRSQDAYRVGTLADSALVKLARFIDQNKWHENAVAQSAVWVLSDSTPMEDIGGEDEVSRKLQSFISRLTGKPLPKYRIEYGRSDGASAQGISSKISGTFEYDVFSNGLVSFGIYDSQGHAVEMFFSDVPRDKGHYVFRYEFSTSRLPKGNYLARLRVDGQVKKEQKFSF